MKMTLKMAAIAGGLLCAGTAAAVPVTLTLTVPGAAAPAFLATITYDSAQAPDQPFIPGVYLNHYTILGAASYTYLGQTYTDSSYMLSVKDDEGHPDINVPGAYSIGGTIGDPSSPYYFSFTLDSPFINPLNSPYLPTAFPGADRNILYVFNAADKFDTQTFENVSYSFTVGRSAAPEPATWAIMVSGFGLVGFAMRRRQSVRVGFA